VPASSLRFGQDFELDVAAYELRRAGRAIRLERIPMEILILLVERRPDLVTRDQIARRIWGQGVFVDTDNSINVAIRKIRQALGDDSENSRFIRTVTGMGYRFVAPVTTGEVASPASVTPSSATVGAVSAALPAVAVPAAVRRRTFAPLLWTIFLGVLAFAATAGFYLHWSHSGPAVGVANTRPMLAVLPFENLTGDAGQDYFSDGFTEEMITRLGSLDPRRLGVIARTSVMYYKQAREPLDQIAHELGVRYVLEGSVRRDGEHVRITAQLIRVADQTHLWAREYDRDKTDILRVQQEIAEAIADRIEVTLDQARSPGAAPVTLSPQDYEAHDLYLRGRHSWNERTQAGFERALESFQQAIARNPAEAVAYAGLADTYTLMGTYGLASQAESVPKAREAALKALELDPDLAAAHTSLALVNEVFDWDWQTAGERFRRAIDLDPNYATAHHWYAEYLGFQGRFEEALAESEQARQLDPLSRIIAADRGAILYYARQYDRAIEQLRAVLAAEPESNRAHLIVSCYAANRQLDEALEQLKTWKIDEVGPWVPAFTAYVYGRMGRSEDARRAALAIETANPSWKGDRLQVRAIADVGMGLKDEAFDALQQACGKHLSTLVDLKVDPIYDPLRDDPRFQDLLRCVHLAP
jgi:TolB-like protein/DNA-binding winged helix-turn-helix (wHTH) protein